MADLSTTFMGLKLSNPIIVGSSDMTSTLEKVMRCEEAGAGAVVLKSFFEEQFCGEGGLSERGAPVYSEAVDYLRAGGLIEYASLKFCQMIEDAKDKVKIPVIASVNCQSAKLWPRLAQQFEQAGADGLELNIYFLPLDLETPGIKYEALHLKILEEVKKSVSIPVSVKLPFQITSVPNLAYRLAEAGCDGLVLFNWFLQPDIDIQNLKTRNLVGKGDFHLSLRWIALLAGRINCDLVSSGGLAKTQDLAKQLLAGASAVQVCTLIYKEGFEAIKKLLEGLRAWMAEHKYESLEDFRGELSFQKQSLSFRDSEMAEAYFRAQYLKVFS
jgi:dihydroorotate dehydrogenase (fumarate)